MNISSIRPYNINFGQVRRSAAKCALEEAKYDVKKLEEIKDIIAEQESNNVCNIYGHKNYVRVYGEYHPAGTCSYTVVPNDINKPVIVRYSLKEAAEQANHLKLLKREEEKPISKQEFEFRAQKIINSCEESCEESDDE